MTPGNARASACLRSLTGLLLLIPAAELAADGDPLRNEVASLGSWSLEALCSARERDDIWAEIERREIFSARELRAIKDGELREGMSLEALICAKGPPDIIVDGVVRRDFGQVDLYVPLADGTAGSALYIFQGSLVYVVDHQDPATIVRHPPYAMYCNQISGRLTDCRLYGDSDRFSAHASSCGPGQLSGATATPQELLTRGRCR